MRRTGRVSVSTVIGVALIVGAFILVVVLFRFLPGEKSGAGVGGTGESGNRVGDATGTGTGGDEAGMARGGGGEDGVVMPAAPARVVRKGIILDVSKVPEMAGLETSRVTLDMDDVPVETAGSMFGSAASLVIEMQGTGNLAKAPLITMHLRDAPVLEGLLELRHQGGMGIREMRANGFALGMPTPGAGVGLWCVSGPFAFTLSQVVSEAQFGGDGLPDTHLVMETLAEPQVKVLRFPQVLMVDMLVDENGQAIKVVPRKAGMLSIQPGSGRKISLFKGTGTFAIAGKSETFETDALTTAHTEKVAGATVELQPLERLQGAAPRFTLKVRYSRGDLPAERWEALASLFFNHRPRVIGVNGEPFTLGVTGSDSMQKDSVMMTFSVTSSPGAANRIGEPNRVIIELPTEIREVKVPFEFRDVLLPG